MSATATKDRTVWCEGIEEVASCAVCYRPGCPSRSVDPAPVYAHVHASSLESVRCNRGKQTAASMPRES